MSQVPAHLSSASSRTFLNSIAIGILGELFFVGSCPVLMFITTLASTHFLARSTQSPLLPLLSSVQFSRSVVSNSLWPNGLQRARPPCSSPTPRVYWNSCPLSWWCHQIISYFVIPLSCPKPFPASRSFLNESILCIRWPKYWSSASVSVLPMNIQDQFPWGWTGWISL